MAKGNNQKQSTDSGLNFEAQLKADLVPSGTTSPTNSYIASSAKRRRDNSDNSTT